MENDTHEVMQGTMVYAFVFLIVAFCAIAGIALAVFIAGKSADNIENQTGIQSLEDRCEFVVKTSGDNFNLSEPKAGTYKYELYATPDGFVEVWKCK